MLLNFTFMGKDSTFELFVERASQYPILHGYLPPSPLPPPPLVAFCNCLKINLSPRKQELYNRAGQLIDKFITDTKGTQKVMEVMADCICHTDAHIHTYNTALANEVSVCVCMCVQCVCKCVSVCVCVCLFGCMYM